MQVRLELWHLGKNHDCVSETEAAGVSGPGHQASTTSYWSIQDGAGRGCRKHARVGQLEVSKEL